MTPKLEAHAANIEVAKEQKHEEGELAANFGANVAGQCNFALLSKQTVLITLNFSMEKPLLSKIWLYPFFPI